MLSLYGIIYVTWYTKHLPKATGQSQIPVAFGISLPGHVSTKHLPDTPCYVLVVVKNVPFVCYTE